MKAFLKDNHRNSKFDDLIESSKAYKMLKSTENDLVQIQYLRLISRDPKVVRELVEAKEKKVVEFLRDLQHFYMVQPLNTPVQLVLVELLQTLKRLYGPAYKAVIGPMSQQLSFVFANYVNNMQFLNEVVIEFLVMESQQMHKILEYLVNPNCKQNKIRGLILIQQNLSDFVRETGRSLFRYIFQLGVQIQRLEEGADGKKNQQKQFVQYLSVVQQIINSRYVDYGAVQDELEALQVMLDGLAEADIIAQMIMVQVMFQLSQDAGVNRILYSSNVNTVLLLLTDYENTLRLDSMNVTQQAGIQQEVL